LPGAVAPAGTVHAYEYVPTEPGVAATAAGVPAQTVGLFTFAVGSGSTVTVPEALAPIHPVVVFVRTTLYVPAIKVVNVETLPGFVAPAGTVQAKLYVPATPGEAVTEAGVPAHIPGLFTVAVGSGFIVTVPEAIALTHVVTVLVIITL
jgi:hypothetical protein